MSYRITYPSFGEEKKQPIAKRGWTGVAAAALVAALVFGAIAVKNTGLTWVQTYLLPGDPAVTAAALDGMVEDLRNGKSLGEAVKDFCQEIIAHANAQ